VVQIAVKNNVIAVLGEKQKMSKFGLIHTPTAHAKAGVRKLVNRK